MNIRYGTRVIITSGFYEGCFGMFTIPPDNVTGVTRYYIDLQVNLAARNPTTITWEFKDDEFQIV